MDFDGTILDSNLFKADCFGQAFSEFGPAAVEFAKSFHLDHLSQPRNEKIREISEILELKISDSEVMNLVEYFGECVDAGIEDCPLVPGVEHFLDISRELWPLFVCSATPQDELGKILERLGLAGTFQRIYGHPIAKEKALRSIATSLCCRPENLLMIGDSDSDRKAALLAGTKFHLIGEDSENSYIHLIKQLGV